MKENIYEIYELCREKFMHCEWKRKLETVKEYERDNVKYTETLESIVEAINDDFKTSVVKDTKVTTDSYESENILALRGSNVLYNTNTYTTFGDDSNIQSRTIVHNDFTGDDSYTIRTYRTSKYTYVDYYISSSFEYKVFRDVKNNITLKVIDDNHVQFENNDIENTGLHFMYLYKDTKEINYYREYADKALKYEGTTKFEDNDSLITVFDIYDNILAAYPDILLDLYNAIYKKYCKDLDLESEGCIVISYDDEDISITFDFNDNHLSIIDGNEEYSIIVEDKEIRERVVELITSSCSNSL